MNQNPSIDLLLPILNPEKGWAEATLKRKQALESLIGQEIGLIISDDGSTQAGEIEAIRALDPKANIIQSHKNRGKGHALREGASVSEADFLVFTDADFPYELESMAAVINALNNGADVALGYREQNYYASVPWFRKGLSEAFRFVLKSVLRFPIADTQCGLKGMSQKGKQCLLQTTINRFLVDMEFIKIANVKKDLLIVPVVVKLRDNVEFSSMGAKVLLRELWNFLRVVFL